MRGDICHLSEMHPSPWRPGSGQARHPWSSGTGFWGGLPAAASTAHLACSHHLPRVAADPGRAPTLSLLISLHSGTSDSTEEVAKGHRVDDSNQDFGQVTVTKDAREEAASFPCGFGGKSLASRRGLHTSQLAYDAGSQRQT